jgi:hypothetical protein
MLIDQTFKNVGHDFCRIAKSFSVTQVVLVTIVYFLGETEWSHLLTFLANSPPSLLNNQILNEHRSHLLSRDDVNRPQTKACEFFSATRGCDERGVK